MWHLPKPDLQKAFDDVDVFEIFGIIKPVEKPILKRLVRDYDRQNAFLHHHQRRTISIDAAMKIHDHYCDTYVGKDLDYIRNELFERVTFCPYCGVSGPQTLDHYMDKSTYQEMSLCRLNLVPMCWDCNRLKSTCSYHDFINPYYFDSQSTEFFVCTVKLLMSDIKFEFSIRNDIFDPITTNVLNKQINVIGSNGKWDRAVVSYLKEDVFSDKDTPSLLIASLSSLIQKKERDANLFNHWKTAVLRGLERVINENSSIAQQILDAVNNKIYF